MIRLDHARNDEASLIEDFFHRPLHDQVGALKINDAGGIVEVSEIIDGPNKGNIVKLLRVTNLNDIRSLKSFATHIQALQKLNRLPILRVPRLINFGSFKKRPALIETRMPDVFSNDGVKELLCGSPEIKHDYFSQLFKFLTFTHKLGVLPVDVKIQDTAFSEKSFSKISRVGLVDLGEAYMKGSNFNTRRNEQDAWDGSTWSMRILANRLFPNRHPYPYDDRADASIHSFPSMQKWIENNAR